MTQNFCRPHPTALAQDSQAPGIRNRGLVEEVQLFFAHFAPTELASSPTRRLLTDIATSRDSSVKTQSSLSLTESFISLRVLYSVDRIEHNIHFGVSFVRTVD